MMDRPTPKELVVTRPSSVSMLWITVGSNDAAAWIEREAPLFGSFHKPTHGATHYTLFVSDVHDTDTVKRYLENYGKEMAMDSWDEYKAQVQKVITAQTDELATLRAQLAEAQAANARLVAAIRATFAKLQTVGDHVESGPAFAAVLEAFALLRAAMREHRATAASESE